MAKSPRISSPAHPSSGGGRGRVARGRGRRDHEIIGQTVRISQGPYKGYIGIVKDATESTARVELHTKCQTISVDRTRLVTIGYDDLSLTARSLVGLPAFPLKISVVNSYLMCFILLSCLCLLCYLISISISSSVVLCLSFCI